MKPAAAKMPTASGGAVGRTNRPTRRALVNGDPIPASDRVPRAPRPHASLKFAHPPRTASCREDGQAIAGSRCGGGGRGDGRGDVIVAVVSGDGLVPAR